MFKEGKNIKDTEQDSSTNLGITIKDSLVAVSYIKTQKLITALYMVTDIMDSDEPIRNKLRTLGVEILSDTSNLSRGALDKLEKKIQEVLSFLDIVSTINIISEMNASILKKEFLELAQSVKESLNKVGAINRQINLAEYFNSPLEEYSDFSRREVDIHPGSQASHPSKGELDSKGHTRLGVQKGSTLMKALSDKIQKARPNMLGLALGVQDFDILKRQRRDEILLIIKGTNGNATIKDIKDMAQASQNKSMSIINCSEKTLQRELISMVKDGVLYKAGEKRWSRYFLKN
jgi:hypothetical protein